MTWVRTLGLIIAFGKPFSCLLFSRFELGDEAVDCVDGELAWGVGTVTERDELVDEVVQEDNGVVVADVELAISVVVWLDSLAELEDEAAEEEAAETVMVCLTVDDTSALFSGVLIGVEGADDFMLFDSAKQKWINKFTHPTF